MRIGRVIGNVTLAVAEPSYRGGRWLMVSPLTREQLAGRDTRRVSAQPSLVVYDNLGSGRGDLIAFVEGAEAAAPFAQPTPVDAINVAILEQIDYRPPPVVA